jgi:hypothetical protein
VLKLGLLSKIKAAGATALSAIKSRLSKVNKTAIASKIIGGAKKIGGSTAGRAIISASKFAVKKAGPVGIGLTVASLGYAGYRKLKKPKAQRTAKQVGVQSGVQSGIKKYITTKNVLRAGVAAVGAGVAAYGAYKLYKAYKKRKKKKKKKSYRRSRSKRSSGRRVSFVTKDGRRVSFVPKQRKTVRFSGFRKRRGQRGLSKTEIQQIKGLIRSGERD